MPKIDIAAGEEFPASEPPAIPPESGPPRHRFRWHFALHLLTRLAFLALLIGALVWMFHGYGEPVSGYGPYAARPHHFFFPFLLLLLLIFAFRRGRHCHYGYWHRMRHWHDDMHRQRGERI